MLHTHIPQSVKDAAQAVVDSGNERNAFAWFNKQNRLSKTPWIDGFVGEMTTKYLMGIDIDTTGNKPDGGVDLIMDGMRVDVKTQSFSRSTPNYTWLFNFAAHQMSDKYDALLFNFIDKNRETLYLAGWITKQDFDFYSGFFQKGEQNPYNSKHTFTCDTYIIKADQLTRHNPLKWGETYKAWNQIKTE